MQLKKTTATIVAVVFITPTLMSVPQINVYDFSHNLQPYKFKTILFKFKTLMFSHTSALKVISKLD